MRGNSILFQLYTEDLDEILRFFFFFYAEYKDSEIKSFLSEYTGWIKISRNFSLESKKKRKKTGEKHYAYNIVSPFSAFNFSSLVERVECSRIIRFVKELKFAILILRIIDD